MKKPFTVGLTGTIGSGKSTAAEFLGNLGAEIVSGDELGKRVLEHDEAVLNEIRKRFGSTVFRENGEINRSVLANLVFSSPEETKWLTELTFPRIYQRWKSAVANSKSQVIVFDAALIAEWGIQGEFDFLLVVVAPEAAILGRAGSSRFSAEELKKRSAVQLQIHEKSLHSDFTITNDGSIDDLRKKIQEVWQEFIIPKIK